MHRLLPLLLLLAAPLAAQTTLLNDTFSDLSITDQNLTSSAFWVSSSSTGMSLVNGTLSLTPGRHALAYFTSAGTTQALAVGDSLTVSLNITFSTVGTASGGFRVGLFDSNGATRSSTNGDNTSFTGYDGYIFTSTLDSTTSNSLTLRERVAGVSGALLSSTTGGIYTTVGSTGGPTGQTLSTGVAYNVTYTITRTDSTTLSQAYYLTGGTLSGFNNTFSDTTASTTEFDTFAILSTSTGGSNFAIDNVLITYSAAVAAVPEPSTYAMIFGGVSFLGLLYQRRRRG